MSSLLRGLCCALVGALVAPAGIAASNVVIPLPRLVIPRSEQAPVMDGKISPGEWDRAAAATGFVTAFENKLSKVQTVVFVTYDDTWLYVALRNYRGENYRQLKMAARKPDDGQIVFDYANEIWITPPATPEETYQTMFNAYPGVFDVKMIPSLGNQNAGWSAGWEVASSETKDDWVVEGRARLDAYSRQAVKDGTIWRGLFTTDVIGGAGFTAWAPGGAFADLPRHGFLEFGGPAPAVQSLDVTNLRIGKGRLVFRVGGPAAGKGEVKLIVRFGSLPDIAEPLQEILKTVSVASGQAVDVPVDFDVASNKAGYCEISAEASGRKLFFQVIPFEVDGFVRTPPAEIVANPYLPKPFGLEARYAPLSRKLLLRVDRNYLAGKDKVAAGHALLRDPESGKVVAEQALAPFHYDYSESVVDLRQLEVPVADDATWKANQPVLEENQKLAKENSAREARGEAPLPLKPLPFPPATYEVEVVLTDASGTKLESSKQKVTLQGFDAEWLNNEIGVSDKVLAPWTPVRETAPGEFSLWNKSYVLDGLGLARRILNAGAPQLSGPMKLTAVIDGKPVVLEATTPTLDGPLSPDSGVARMHGQVVTGGLRFSNNATLEMDGAVINRLSVAPEQKVTLDALTLEVRMPAHEAPFYATTAGGWTSSFGDTPEKWDCSLSSLGARTKPFVPYLLLTDSDRGFTLFTDTDRGWILDAAKPSQEFFRDGKDLVVRYHFVNRPVILEKPLMVEYGWVASPQKPQPEGWRRYEIGDIPTHPTMRTLAWANPWNSSWWFVYPYYSSPFPFGRKSKVIGDYQEFAEDLAISVAIRMVTQHAGAIMHAIGRYLDDKGRPFLELVPEWGVDKDNTAGVANTVLNREVNNFRVWHIDKAVRLSGLEGMYFDECYLTEDYNELSGGAYLLPDGRLEPGYHFLGMRDFTKRLRHVFAEHGKGGLPNLWLHTTAQQAVHAWLGDVSWEGENVSPGGLENDYLDAHPASRLRSIGMGRNLGTIPLIFCQAASHYVGPEEVRSFLVHQFVGWVLAHDCLPSRDQQIYSAILGPELELWSPETRFLPYWKKGEGISTEASDVFVSAHSRPGQAVLWVVNASREKTQAPVEVDLKALQLTGHGNLFVFDVETGVRIKHTVKGDDLKFSLEIPARLWRGVRIVRSEQLTDSTAFVAAFDRGEVSADEAFGCRFPANGHGDLVAGKSGQGLSLEKPVSFQTRLHLNSTSGGVRMDLECDPATANGSLFRVGNLSVRINRGQIFLFNGETVLAQGSVEGAGRRWIAIAIEWSDGVTRVAVDGKTIVEHATVPVIPALGHGLNVEARSPDKPKQNLTPTRMQIGPVPGVVLDNLILSQKSKS